MKYISFETIIMGDCLRAISLFIFYFVVSIVYSQTISEYSLYAVVGEGNKVIRFRILPNGQIIDSFQNYTTINNTFDITHDLNRKFLFISCAGGLGSSTTGISTFNIQNDGTLIPMDATTTESASFMSIVTPNNQLLLAITQNVSKIYSLSSSGILSDTGNTFFIGVLNTKVEPLGRFALTAVPTTTGFQYYKFTIDYVAKTLTLTQTLSGAGNGTWGIKFPKSGTMGLVYGLQTDTTYPYKNLSVIWIDSLGNVTTTNQGFVVYNSITDVTLSPDDRYAFLSATTTMHVFSINTVNRTIADTGIRWAPPNIRYCNKFLLNDYGNFGVLLYEATDGRNWLATAFIEPGTANITWTGYAFAFDSIYDFGTATHVIEWVPVYTTSIPPELWMRWEE